ncbi:hypothetical protein [Saccharopolyspora elongata]|nr:hypothetical protein [Saccharopolyspora elongata]
MVHCGHDIFTGSANLVVNAWTADMGDLMNMQDNLERPLPGEPDPGI